MWRPDFVRAEGRIWHRGRAARTTGSVATASTRTPLFASLPERGIWTQVGLTRGQFLGILGLSVALFVVVGGPIWLHVHDGHFLRITLSYGFIPIAVAVALWRNGTLRLGLLLGASAVIAALKLLLTAGLLVVVAIARTR
jgi:hypothetical protein